MVTAACLRYASADTFFCIQEINIGMVADVGTLQRLPKLMPMAVVKELAYTGRRLNADKALQHGLVNEICADQASTLAPRVETLGAVTLGGGANTIRVNANAALVVAQLSLDSLIRTDNATAVLLGSFMEDPVSPRRGDIVVRNGADLQNALVGGGG
jgi:enoyl-CoA hydratase/carnithine racemase